MESKITFVFTGSNGDLHRMKVLDNTSFLDIRFLVYLGMVGEFQVLWDNEWEEVDMENDLELHNFLNFIVRNFSFIKKFVNYEEDVKALA